MSLGLLPHPLTLLLQLGWGVIYPTGRSFDWHFGTVRNKVKRFGDFSWLWLGYKTPWKLLSCVAPEIQYGGWKHEYAIEILKKSGRFTKPCRNVTRHHIFMRFSTILMIRHKWHYSILMMMRHHQQFKMAADKPEAVHIVYSGRHIDLHCTYMVIPNIDLTLIPLGRRDLIMSKSAAKSWL